jgi:hypothetical protein
MTPRALSDLSIASVRGDPALLERTAPRPSIRRSDGKRSEATTADGCYFPPPGFHTTGQIREARFPGFASRNKIAAARRPLLRSGRCR